MSGYVSVLAHCYACGKLFSSNPVKVPSYNGEPICLDCITRVNEHRQANGLPIWYVAPDAYEAADEGELGC